MLRPSINTNSLLAKRPLKPREVTAHLFASIRATCIPGTIRNASGILVTPERRISSPVIAKTAAAASKSLSSFLDTEVISMSISSSRLSSVRSTGMSPAQPAAVTENSNNVQISLLSTIKLHQRRTTDSLCHVEIYTIHPGSQAQSARTPVGAPPCRAARPYQAVSRISTSRRATICSSSSSII